jgi:hypothetical protein
MRSADLLGAVVLDAGGGKVGIVHDLHLERSSEAFGSGQPAYRISALECGPAGYAHRLGYGHRDLAGPWPLNLLFARMVRRSRLVEWEQIDQIGDRRIRLSVDASSLRPVSAER